LELGLGGKIWKGWIFQKVIKTEPIWKTAKTGLKVFRSRESRDFIIYLDVDISLNNSYRFETYDIGLIF